MTRRERRGTIVLLVLMAIVIAVFSITKFKQENLLQTEYAAELETFEKQTDTIVFTVEKTEPNKPDKKRHAAKKRAAKKEKPSSDKPRRLDPVPQF